MDYKLKNRDGVETTYAKDKIKIPAATGDSMVVFTQGEAQAEKTVDIAKNGAFTVEPDAGFSFVKRVSGTVAVPGPDFSQVTATAADVLKGKKNDEEELVEFYDCFEVNFSLLATENNQNDNFVNFEIFANFYEYVAFVYDNDAEFEAVVSSTWKC